MSGAALTPFLETQLLLLYRAGAIDLETAACIHTPGCRTLDAGAVGGRLLARGLTHSRVKGKAGASRTTHYRLTAAGLEQAQALHAEASR